MFRGLLIFLLSVPLWTASAEVERRPMNQMRKSLSIALSAIHKSPTSLAARQLQEAAIHEGISGVVSSFYLDSFLDDTISLNERSDAVKSMWYYLRTELLKYPELLKPEIAAIFLQEIDKISKDVKKRDARKNTEFANSYVYSVPETMLLEAPARGSWYLGGKGLTSFRKWRAGENWRTADFWSNWNLKREWNDWRAKQAQRPRPKNLAALCQRTLKNIWNKKTGLFVLRHMGIGLIYSVPNYFFKFRPLFWGFNNYEAWDSSEDLMSEEIRPFFADLVKHPR